MKQKKYYAIIKHYLLPVFLIILQAGVTYAATSSLVNNGHFLKVWAPTGWHFSGVVYSGTACYNYSNQFGNCQGFPATTANITAAAGTQTTTCDANGMNSNKTEFVFMDNTTQSSKENKAIGPTLSATLVDNMDASNKITLFFLKGAGSAETLSSDDLIASVYNWKTAVTDIAISFWISQHQASGTNSASAPKKCSQQNGCAAVIQLFANHIDFSNSSKIIAPSTKTNLKNTNGDCAPNIYPAGSSGFPPLSSSAQLAIGARNE